MELLDCVKNIGELLVDMKAKMPLYIDVCGKTKLCKYIIVCSGDSVAFNKMLAEKIASSCQLQIIHNEGYVKAEWILLDYGEIVVHIFLNEFREKYNLEKLWKDNKNIVEFAKEKKKSRRSKI